MSDHARKRRSSLHVSLVLIGGMALSNGEARTSNATAGGGNWTAVQGKSVITNMATNSASRYYRGSTYYHGTGTAGSAKAASSPDGASPVSRGGFGGSAASHSSGG
ncbi:MAG: hypothetical protein AABZ39_06560 [Spirochaetota bacterium]